MPILTDSTAFSEPLTLASLLMYQHFQNAVAKPMVQNTHMQYYSLTATATCTYWNCTSTDA